MQKDVNQEKNAREEVEMQTHELRLTRA